MKRRLFLKALPMVSYSAFGSPLRGSKWSAFTQVIGNSGIAMNQVTSATLLHWYDANDHSTVFADDAGTILQTTNGGQVERVNDKVGTYNIKGLGDGFPIWAPTLDTSAQNGKWGFNFNQTNSRLTGAAFTTVNFPVTTVAVFKQSQTANRSTLVAYTGNGDPNYEIRLNTSNQYHMASAINIMDFSTTDTLAHVLISVWNGASSAWSLDGSALTVGADIGNNGIGGICLGALTTNAFFYAGWINEYGMYSGTISGADVTALSLGLKNKWATT